MKTTVVLVTILFAGCHATGDPQPSCTAALDQACTNACASSNATAGDTIVISTNGAQVTCACISGPAPGTIAGRCDTVGNP